MVRFQLLGERPKGKYSTAKTLNGPRGFEVVFKLGKCHLYRRIHTLNLYLLQTYSHLEHKQIYSHYIDGWVKILWGHIQGTIF